MASILARLNELEKQLDQKELLDIAYKFFVDITPIDSGNAKKNTVSKTGEGIYANYPYATRLNNGWSDQAKQGMSKPTIQHLQNHIKNVRK